ncbi:MAG TPA: hypothetical protein VL221_02815 [Bacteroidota bacterium]|nr:hypothetical protein [Bacteroidota bacterium]
MTNVALYFISAAILIGWGVAHMIPTKKVVEAFGAISQDNKRIITMEWIIEGATLIFIGALISVVTIVDRSSTVSRATYLVSIAMLNALSVISLFTGSRVKHLAFKLCPVIFSGSSLLVLLGLCL